MKFDQPPPLQKTSFEEPPALPAPSPTEAIFLYFSKIQPNFGPFVCRYFLNIKIHNSNESLVAFVENCRRFSNVKANLCFDFICLPKARRVVSSGKAASP